MIPLEKPHVRAAAASHPGMTGKNNEDRYRIQAYRTDQEPSQPVVFAVVADGIGGHQAGEIAAEMAIENLCQYVAASDGLDPVSSLREAFIQTSRAISMVATQNPGWRGMGSTCACALLVGSRLYITAVGDTRIYLVRGNHIQQANTDHTWVQEAIQLGILSSRSARSHPNAHVIKRYLGSPQDVEPDTRLYLHPDETDDQAESNQGLVLQPGDRLILCTDGLSDLVREEEILSAFKRNDQIKAINHLIKLANRRGGHDNITIVTLQMPDEKNPFSSRWKRVTLWSCFLLVVLVFLLGMLTGGIYWFYLRPTASTSAETTPIPAGLVETVFPASLTTTSTGARPSQSVETSLPSLPTSPLATLTAWPTNTPLP